MRKWSARVLAFLSVLGGMSLFLSLFHPRLNNHAAYRILWNQQYEEFIGFEGHLLFDYLHHVVFHAMPDFNMAYPLASPIFLGALFFTLFTFATYNLLSRLGYSPRVAMAGCVLIVFSVPLVLQTYFSLEDNLAYHFFYVLFLTLFLTADEFDPTEKNLWKKHSKGLLMGLVLGLGMAFQGSLMWVLGLVVLIPLELVWSRKLGFSINMITTTLVALIIHIGFQLSIMGRGEYILVFELIQSALSFEHYFPEVHIDPFTADSFLSATHYFLLASFHESFQPITLVFLALLGAAILGIFWGHFREPDFKKWVRPHMLLLFGLAAFFALTYETNTVERWDYFWILFFVLCFCGIVVAKKTWLRWLLGIAISLQALNGLMTLLEPKIPYHKQLAKDFRELNKVKKRPELKLVLLPRRFGIYESNIRLLFPNAVVFFALEDKDPYWFFRVPEDQLFTYHEPRSPTEGIALERQKPLGWISDRHGDIEKAYVHHELQAVGVSLPYLPRGSTN